MDSAVYTRIYEAPSLNRKEILRYAGVFGASPEIEALLDGCIKEVDGRLSFKVCYREFDISAVSGVLDLEFVKTNSEALRKNLDGCSSVILFAATVGVEIDRLIARYRAVSPTRSLLLGAIGSERIESLCDLFCLEISEEKAKVGYITRPRFSPGYGDLPLDMQRAVFAALDCPRKIGVTLNDSLLMSPSKSVTAIIGLCRAR